MTMGKLGRLSLAFAIVLPAAGAAQAPPASVAGAMAVEQADALPLTAFYDTPANFAAAKPGQLLRQEAVTDYTIPAGVKATRILYRSTDGQGRPTVTSGVVLVPAGQAPAGGWPLIAWAHGTSGVARACAPSLMKDVYYGDEGLSDMLKAGFAVVATDYHGLGTAGLHRYVDKDAQADDIIHSVPAARAAVPDLSREWVVDGHSQGGLAAWAVAEQQRRIMDPGYRGAVAVAAATHLRWLLDHPEASTGAGFYLAWIAYAVHTRYPQFRVADMLSPAGLAHYREVTAGKGCWFYGYAAYHGIEATQMVQPGWKTNVWVRRFVTANSAGGAPIGGPILAIAGEADGSVPIGGVRDTIRKACARGIVVDFRVYPGLDHDPTMTKSTPDQLAWIRDRFAGKPAAGNC